MMKSLIVAVLAVSLQAPLAFAKLSSPTEAVDQQLSEATLNLQLAQTAEEKAQAKSEVEMAMMAKCANGRAAGTIDPLCYSLFIYIYH